jgi:hypothetical protein
VVIIVTVLRFLSRGKVKVCCYVPPPTYSMHVWGGQRSRRAPAQRGVAGSDHGNLRDRRPSLEWLMWRPSTVLRKHFPAPHLVLYRLHFRTFVGNGRICGGGTISDDVHYSCEEAHLSVVHARVCSFGAPATSCALPHEGEAIQLYRMWEKLQ